jgi:hypothetical protein
MGNQREFSYVTWTDELFQGQIFEMSNDARFPNERIGEGPPMRLVLARTFLDVAPGHILEIDEVERYRAPYVQVEDAEACPPNTTSTARQVARRPLLRPSNMETAR